MDAGMSSIIVISADLKTCPCYIVFFLLIQHLQQQNLASAVSCSMFPITASDV